MLSPSATASDRRLSTTTPHPSPRTKPSAEASKVLHRPSAAIMCDFEKLISSSGARITLTPPARAIRQSPSRRLGQARETATREEEQAVSSEMLGPCKPRVNDTRPEATLWQVPVAR